MKKSKNSNYCSKHGWEEIVCDCDCDSKSSKEEERECCGANGDCVCHTPDGGYVQRARCRHCQSQPSDESKSQSWEDEYFEYYKNPTNRDFDGNLMKLKLYEFIKRVRTSAIEEEQKRCANILTEISARSSYYNIESANNYNKGWETRSREVDSKVKKAMKKILNPNSSNPDEN